MNYVLKYSFETQGEVKSGKMKVKNRDNLFHAKVSLHEYLLKKYPDLKNITMEEDEVSRVWNMFK
jgi:hypothetical protein